MVARQRRLRRSAEPLVRGDAVVDRHQHAADRLLDDVGELLMAMRQQERRELPPTDAERAAVLDEALPDLPRRAAMAPEERIAQQELPPQLRREALRQSLGLKARDLRLVDRSPRQHETLELDRRGIRARARPDRADGAARIERVLRRGEREIGVDLDRQVGVDDDRRLAAANPLVDLDRAEADRRAVQERIRHQWPEFHQLAHLGEPRQLPTDQEVVEDVQEREAASDMAADAAPEQIPPLPDAGGDRQFLTGARQLPELGPGQGKELAALVRLRLGWPDEDPLGALRRRRLQGDEPSSPTA